MPTSWNEKEKGALHGLPHMAQVMYLQCFRCHMDYTSGIVGRSRRISYQQMSEWLEVSRKAGSTEPSFTPSYNALRAAIKQLVAAGLVERIPGDSKFDPLCFRLPLATVNKLGFSSSYSNKPESASIRLDEETQENHKEGTTGGATGQNKVTPLYMVSSEQGGTEGTTREPQERSDTPQGSGKEDRKIDGDSVLKVGEAIELMIEGGAQSGKFMFKNHLDRVAELVKLGTTASEVTEACRKARLAKNDEPFSVFYLEPIIRKMVMARKHPNSRGSNHDKSARQLAEEQLDAGDRVYEHED